MDGREFADSRDMDHDSGHPGHIETVMFSPDSQRVAYLVFHSSGRFPRGEGYLFVDGLEQPRHDGVMDFMFSPDSSRVAHVVRIDKRIKGLLRSKKVGESYMVVIDGQQGRQYDSIIASPQGGRIMFDSPDQLHYFAQKDGAFYWVEEQLG